MGPETPAVTDRLRTFVALALVALAATAGCVGPFAGGTDPTPTEAPDRTATGAESTPSPTPIHPNYEQTTVTVLDGETGEELGRVEAAIADNRSLRITGLSETDRLPEDRGMLFVHGDVGERTYVMRNMSFGLDIVFADADGRITAVREAPKPGPGENGADQEYTGEARYVLEVNRGWTDERGVEAGDRVEFELPG